MAVVAANISSQARFVVALGATCVALGVVVALVASMGHAEVILGLTGGACIAVCSILVGLRTPTILVSLYLFTLTASPTFQLAGVSVSLADPVAVGALVVTAIKARTSPANSAGIAAVGWLSVMLVSLIQPLLTANPFAVANLLRVLRMAMVLLPIFLAGTVSLSFVTLARILLMGISLGLASGIGQVYFGLTSVAADQYIYLPSGTIHRAAGIYGESSTFGDMGAICFLVAVLTLQYATKTRDRVLALVAAPVGLWALVLGYSRSSLVFCMIGLGIVVLLARGRPGRFTIPLAIVAFGGILTYLIEPRLVEAFATQRLGLLSSSGLSGPTDLTSGRFTTWPAIVGQFSTQPALWLFGIGYKMLALDPSNPILYGPADNNYISVLVETGVVGLTAFAFWLFKLTRALWSLPVSPPRTMAIAVLAGLSVEAITADAFTYYRVIGILVLVYVCAAEVRRVPS